MHIKAQQLGMHSWTQGAQECAEKRKRGWNEEGKISPTYEAKKQHGIVITHSITTTTKKNVHSES